MKVRNQHCNLLLTSFITLNGCTKGPTESSRTNGARSNDSSEIINETGKGPGDESLNPPGYTKPQRPLNTEGTMLVDIKSICVATQEAACQSIRLSAEVKSDTNPAVLFTPGAMVSLGIKAFSWSLENLTEDVQCLFKDSGYEFYPLCSTATGSLSSVPLRVALNLTLNDGSNVVGKPSEVVPLLNGKIQGNFMLLSRDSWLKPTNIKYPGATAAFDEVWLSLVNNIYVSNILFYEVALNTFDWNQANVLCRDAGDGWRLPTGAELCGDNFKTGSCDGGLFNAGIKQAAMNGGDWNKSVVSSTIESGGRGEQVWTVNLSTGLSMPILLDSRGFSVICVHR